MTEKISKEMSIAYFGSLILGLTALKLANPNNPRPIPSNWLFPERKLDPNIVLESLLVNVTNQCFSILNLSTYGYTWPARIVLRTTLELTWLTIVLVNERDKMLHYCQPLDDEEERNLFHKHFSGNKLQKALTGIERNLHFADDIRLLYSNARSEAYSFFTKHVHNSYAATITGTRAPSIENPDTLEYALFGIPSMTARGVISNLNQQVLFYLIGVLLSSLKISHSFNAVKLWDDIVTSRECFVRLYAFQNS